MVYPPLKTDYVVLQIVTPNDTICTVTQYVSVFSNWAATYHIMSTRKEKSQCLHLQAPAVKDESYA
jgi:hypothetical protein